MVHWVKYTEESDVFSRFRKKTLSNDKNYSFQTGLYRTSSVMKSELNCKSAVESCFQNLNSNTLNNNTITTQILNVCLIKETSFH